jgi:hypothetical protein
VLLPIPGSPASSTTCPATKPPPKTRSSSLIFVEILEVLLEAILDNGCAFFCGLIFDACLPAEALAKVGSTVSTKLPQELQLGHLPDQPTWEYPHCWQTYLELNLAIKRIIAHKNYKHK